MEERLLLRRPFIVFVTGSLTGLELASLHRMEDKWAPGVHLSPVLGLQGHSMTPGFFTWVWSWRTSPQGKHLTPKPPDLLAPKPISSLFKISRCWPVWRDTRSKKTQALPWSTGCCIPLPPPKKKHFQHLKTWRLLYKILHYHLSETMPIFLIKKNASTFVDQSGQQREACVFIWLKWGGVP